jgi:hypothetical protein
VLVATACTLGAPSMPAIAGARPQVDLSVSVTTTPEPFVPGGIGSVTMTVHNAGPDTAGATVPNESISVIEDDFVVTTQPPPFEVRPPVTGCWAERVESDWLPDGSIRVNFVFHFASIPAGESRVCTYNVEFYSSTQSSFSTGWLVHTANDDDINPDNDRFDYTFVAAPTQAFIPVPTSSAISLLILSAGLLFAVAGTREWRAYR